ncbi:MAG: hypothetical protein M3N59_01915 [bacterium]|nr:hypothetical protein [bacterium]
MVPIFPCLPVGCNRRVGGFAYGQRDPGIVCTDLLPPQRDFRREPPVQRSPAGPEPEQEHRQVHHRYGSHVRNPVAIL